jgi:hypothetical protein
MPTVDLEEITAEEKQKLDTATKRAQSLPNPLDPNSGPLDEVGESIRSQAAFFPQEALRRPQTLYLVELRKDLELAVDLYPAEWIYAYRLCGVAMEITRYAESVLAGEHALKLRPADPRSYYGLATGYRMLTRARLEAV